MVEMKLLFQLAETFFMCSELYVGDGVCTDTLLPLIFGKNILHLFC